MSSSKIIYLKRDFAAGVYLSEAPFPPRFWFGVGSESGQIQTVKLLQNVVSSSTNTLHPLSAPHCLKYTVLSLTQGRGGGRVEPERRLGGQQFTPAAKSLTGQLF